MKSLDVKSVRDRFRHLHSAASLGGTSQQSMPSRASIDAYSSPMASQQSTLKPVVRAEGSPRHGQDSVLPQPQGASAGEPSILRDFRQSREASPRLGQDRQLPQPHGTPVSEASILEDFRKHREALAEASPRLGQTRQLPQPQGSPASKAILQEFREYREAVQARAGLGSGQPALTAQSSEQKHEPGMGMTRQAESLQAEAVGNAAPAAEEVMRQEKHTSLQRQIQVCSSRVCGLQVCHYPQHLGCTA